MLLTTAVDAEQNKLNLSVMNHASYPSKKLNSCRKQSAAQRLDVLAKLYLHFPPLHWHAVGGRLSDVHDHRTYGPLQEEGSNTRKCFFSDKSTLYSLYTVLISFVRPFS